MRRLDSLDNLLELDNAQASQASEHLLLLLNLVDDLAIKTQNSHPARKRKEIPIR